MSASIMAHPLRARMVSRLLDTLDRDVPVHWDPDSTYSPGSGDRVWSVAREAWLMADPSADFHVLIQDDAVPCGDFLAGMERALAHVPDYALVSPYFGRGRNVPARWGQMAEQADRRGENNKKASWIRSYTLMWGVSIAVPTRFIADMVRWCDRKAGMPDDKRVGQWFIAQRIDTLYTWPSLVDHRRCESLTKHRQVERVAVRHHDGSALDLDWTGPTVCDPHMVRSRARRSGPTTQRGEYNGNQRQDGRRVLPLRR